MPDSAATNSRPLEFDHLTQLKEYMNKVEEFLESELTNHQFVVTGYLIGAMPALSTQAEGERMLLREIRKRGIGESWEVIGIRQLIERSRSTHMAAINTLEEDLEEEALGDHLSVA